jgi:hypothetical protein
MTNLEHLFGKPISTYTDDMAVQDGILIPFIDRDRDTGDRMTASAWHDLTEYHRAHGYPDYADEQFYRFFYAELQPLVAPARHAWDHSDILKTDYTFNTNQRAEGTLWYIPNERGGITIMKPEDY